MIISKLTLQIKRLHMIPKFDEKSKSFFKKFLNFQKFVAIGKEEGYNVTKKRKE
jgi:hypothetical protein